jgi:hypothetical protein
MIRKLSSLHPLDTYMRNAALLPLLLVLAGCRDPGPTPNLLRPQTLPAADFISVAVAGECEAGEFYDEFGPPTVQEQDGALVFLYDCQDRSVRLFIDREKFDRGIIDVIEGERY